MATYPFGATADGTTIDRLHLALAHEYRRLVLAHFETSPTRTASLTDLTAYVAARRSPSDPRPAEQIRTRLHHADLPKLEGAGLVEYDARTATVRYREQAPIEGWGDYVAEVRE